MADVRLTPSRGQSAAPGPAACEGRPTILHLTVETEEVDVLDRIRAALPAGCKVELAPVGPAGSLRPPPSRRGEPGGADIAGLTGRQRDVLALVRQGLSNKEIGRRLSLSHFTVRNHLSQSLRLLNVASRKAAIARLAEVDLGRDAATGEAGD